MLSGLLSCAGSWRGTNRLYAEPGKPEDSPATATVTPVLGGLFVRLDYTWVYGGAPQEGSILIGCHAKTGAVAAHWIDSWHMGSAVMVSDGVTAPSEQISVRGSYAAPPGPDWGWRTTITAAGGDTLRFVMHNITPDGQEAVAVEAAFTRS